MLSGIWLLAILVLSVLPGKTIPKVGFGFFDQTDKVAHLFVYAVLSFLLGYEVYKRYRSITTYQLVAILVICMIYGVALELLQQWYLSDRFFEIADIIANIIGSLLGVIVVYIFIEKRKKYEY